MSAINPSGDRGAVHPPPPRDSARILADCRDLAVQRLLVSFTSMLDRVSELLMARAERSDVREEQTQCLDARALLHAQRANLMSQFETRLRERVNDRVAHAELPKADFAALDARKLTLVDTTAMDESVLLSNIVRVVENLCEGELRQLNHAIGYLLGRPDLETSANPLGPTTIIEGFTQALHGIEGDQPLKLVILKELNQTSLEDINTIYAALNRHLEGLKVVPATLHRSYAHPRAAGERAGSAARGGAPGGEAPVEETPPSAGAEIDLLALLQRFANARLVRGGAPAPMPPGLPAGGIQVPPAGVASAGAGYALAPGWAGPAGGYPPAADAAPSPGYALTPGWAGPTAGYSAAAEGMAAPIPAVGPFGGPRILVTPELGDALGRLQHGETGFDFGGVPMQFSGLQQDMHNVLRDLQESPLGARANQLEAMTIELVAMLFDFIFETKDLPDSIKALVGRLQIPVLKAAMLDAAFFSKKSHPSRLLVNALAHAGIGWSPTMGQDDPLYRKIESIVRRVLDEFADDIGLFDVLREDLEAFLAKEEQAAEVNIQSTAEEINQRDRQEIAAAIARSEVERRLREHPTPNFLAGFLREKWQTTLAQLYLQEGEESEAWTSALSTLDDLVWSVQPKRANEDRKKLVAMLRNLLRRLHGGLQNIAWQDGEREQFMANLVAAHAAAVKSGLASAVLPTAAVAEAASVAAEAATASGDVDAANKARALAEAMAPAAPAPEPEPEPEAPQDRFAEIAGSLDRGMWVEFEGEDGQLAFAKLAWVSPLRGTYLFTNRQGQKAVSLTANELAERFRGDRARLVEAEPLVDRAFVSMMVSIEEKLGTEPAQAAQPA